MILKWFYVKLTKFKIQRKNVRTSQKNEEPYCDPVSMSGRTKQNLKKLNLHVTVTK